MPRKKSEHNPGYITKPFCDERFGRVIDKLDVIANKVDDLKNKQEERGRDWKSFIAAVISGSLVALVAWGLANLAH